MTALIVGTLLALAALAYVLYPLFAGPSAAADPRGPAMAPGEGAADSSLPDEAVEAAIRRARAGVPACLTCGPRPEPDAAYCSACGRYLAGVCGGCGASVDEAGARFCTQCGRTLAA